MAREQTRRDFLQSAGWLALATASWLDTAVLSQAPAPQGRHSLPPLPYPYNALEPYIDEETMRLHHDVHHAAYVRGLNQAEQALAEARAGGNYALVQHWERQAAFHGSGHFLHSLFWEIMGPKGGGQPSGPLAAQIRKDFGSFEAFRAHFSAAAAAVEGNGWGILAWQPLGQQLVVLAAENHQKQTQWFVIPLLVLDVWEHAYYLKYRNRRAEYIQNWWNVVNWPAVEERFQRVQALEL